MVSLNSPKFNHTLAAMPYYIACLLLCPSVWSTTRSLTHLSILPIFRPKLRPSSTYTSSPPSRALSLAPTPMSGRSRQVWRPTSSPRRSFLSGPILSSRSGKTLSHLPATPTCSASKSRSRFSTPVSSALQSGLLLPSSLVGVNHNTLVDQPDLEAALWCRCILVESGFDDVYVIMLESVSLSSTPRACISLPSPPTPLLSSVSPSPPPSASPSARPSPPT